MYRIWENLFKLATLYTKLVIQEEHNNEARYANQSDMQINAPLKGIVSQEMLR